MVDLLINGLEKLHPIDDALKAKVASIAKISEYKSDDYILKGGKPVIVPGLSPKDLFVHIILKEIDRLHPDS
jgi:hypothetical protein